MPTTPFDGSHHLDRAMARIHEAEPRVKAWELIDEPRARATAEKLGSDQKHPLQGLVVGVKDVIDVEGMPTKSGSRGRATASLAGADATVVARLRSAGAIILGKTKTTEFAFTDPADTTNPFNPDHTPGGSSSGSAAAVAAGMADICLGTQTVGSVCRPAAYCGVAAFKPSTGLTPSLGVTPLASSFDTVGFFAKQMRLAVEAFACSAATRVTNVPAEVSFDKVRIGVLSDAFYLDCEPSVSSAIEKTRRVLERMGAHVCEIKAKVDFQAMRDDHRSMMFREAAAAHGKLLDRAELLGPNWRAGLEAGLKVSEAAYWSARDRLSDAKAQLSEACSEVEILLLPPARSPAPKGIQSTGDAGFILPWTVFGGPIAVLPVDKAQNGLPTAVMIAGKPMTDSRTGHLAIRLDSELT